MNIKINNQKVDTTKSKVEFPTLYKLTSSGKIMEWKVVAENYNGYASYTVSFGYENGAIQNTETIVKNGKNIGHSNETTVWEQCILEARSQWNKQKDRQGYSLTRPTEKPLRPMLAKSFNKAGSDLFDLKDGKHIKFPAFWQPKLDGCVSGDTLIKTKEFGYKPISWIVENQVKCKVLSMDKNGRLEYKSIKYYFTNKETNENIEWFEILLESGEKITLTGNHPVYLPDLGCWRRVDELKGNENLMVL